MSIKRKNLRRDAVVGASCSQYQPQSASDVPRAHSQEVEQKGVSRASNYRGGGHIFILLGAPAQSSLCNNCRGGSPHWQQLANQRPDQQLTEVKLELSSNITASATMPFPCESGGVS